MDPYLENPAHWRGFHQLFISEMWRSLNQSLPAGFVARPEQRIYILEPDKSLIPDVVVTRKTTLQPIARAASTATIDPPVVYSLPPEEVTESFIEIVAVGIEQRVVTVIELLSPANKSRGRGREEYMNKRTDLLHSDVHLMEIDLLRGGEQTVLIPQIQQPGTEFLVSLHRGNGTWNCEPWSFGIRDRMPCVGVPLTEGFPDIPMDLQAIHDEIHDLGRYSEILNYISDPEPPLTPTDSEWVDTLLRETGFRSDRESSGNGVHTGTGNGE
jgi:hypothetical protein